MEIENSRKVGGEGLKKEIENSKEGLKLLLW